MAQLPMLYSMDPYFYVKVKKSYSIKEEDIKDYERRGKMRSAMLNYLKEELDLKSHARLGIFDAHFAFGVIKVRRASDEEDHPQAGQPIESESGEPMLDPETNEPLVYPDKKPVNERYELDRVNPDDMLFGEDSGPLEKSWPWLGQRIVMTKAKALKDGRFKRSVINSIRGRSRDDTGKSDAAVSTSDLPKDRKPEDEFIDFWEIYDIDRIRQWLMVAENAEDLVIKPRGCPPGVEKHPYSFLRFTLRASSPYPIPPTAPMLGPQKEINLSRSRILTHRKRFNRKYEVDINKLENADDQISKLESGDDGTIVRTMALGSVAPIIDAPLDQQTYTELALLNNDLIEISGTSDNARGIAKSDSATEASLLDKRLEIREGDRMSMVVDWVTDVAKKLDQLVQYHIDRKRRSGSPAFRAINTSSSKRPTTKRSKASLSTRSTPGLLSRDCRILNARSGSRFSLRS
jgi:hypothetical protein